MNVLIACLFLIVAMKSASTQLEYCTECRCCVGGICNSEETCTFGCIEGTAGGKCWIRCPSNCKGCAREAIPVGSSNPRLCTSCVDGKYLDQMKTCSSCPVHCKTCKSPTLCTTCKHSYYNSGTVTNCSLHCPGNCECNSPGVCTKCKTGYYDIASYCTNSCSSGCLNRSCNQASGLCSLGCKSSFTGDKCCSFNGHCQTCSSNAECNTCVQGYYGNNCDVTCSNNCEDGCKRTSGQCVNCKAGTYGTICEYNCSACDVSCSRENGLCSFGCVDGYHGQLCNGRCSANCRDKMCHQETGHCLQCVDGFEGTTCLQKTTQQSIIGPVIGGVVGFIVITVGIMVGCFILKKKRNAQTDYADGNGHKEVFATSSVTAEKTVYYNVNDTAVETGTNPQSDSVYEEVTKEGLENNIEGTVDNVDDASCYYNVTSSINVSDMCYYVMNKSIDFFQEEYSRLPKGIRHLCTVAERPENISKNRFNEIYPYDQSRVTINREPDFFINACYIDGYEIKKRYIACIGPTKKTTDGFKTFWKIVWYENTEVIVMLTNLNESSIMKSEQYWPDLNRRVEYGDINISCDSDREFAEYTIRTFTLSKKSQTRTLTQVQCTVWPDKHGPDVVASLVELRQCVRDIAKETTGPVIVHCSAGVGRTGTYIALDRLTEEGEKTGSVNVCGCIISMRDQRVNMVQTTEQYILLHRALAQTLSAEYRNKEQSTNHVNSEIYEN